MQIDGTRAARLLAVAAVIALGAAGGLLPGAAQAAAYPTSGFTIDTIGGDGTACAALSQCGDGVAATTAPLHTPEAVAVDHAGDLFVVDAADNAVRKITPTGTISTIAGDGSACTTPPSCGDGGPARSARLNFPEGIAVDGQGNVYIADFTDYEVRKVTPNGTITTVAGNGTPCGAPPACGDGGPATSAQLEPDGLAVDGSGNLFIVDFGDNEVRKVTPAGVITRFAGTGVACTTLPSCGDGGPAPSAKLNQPTGVAVDGAGNVYVADTDDDAVRQITTTGTISTIAGSGTLCTTAPACGDGGPATLARLHNPEGVAVDSAGNVFIADSTDNEVRRVTPGGLITRVAGTGALCTAAPACGDGGAATSAALSSPDGLAVDSAGNVLVADSLDNEVRWLTGPQIFTGPPGPPGPPGAQGPAGQRGPQGPAARVVLVAFAASTAHHRVAVRYVLTADAEVTLTVSARRVRSRIVARGHGHAGLGQLLWNETLGGHAAPRHRRYTLTLTATVGGRAASSRIAVGL